MAGWVKVHRQLLESEIFANSKALKIFLWLILKANIKTRFVPLKIGAGDSAVKIEYAQLLFGRFKAEEELGIDGSTIYKWLKKMEEMTMILIQSNSHYSIITICNFELYQGVDDIEVTTEEQPSNSRVTTEEQPSNTPKKVKKEEESKETTIPYDEIFVSYNKICGVKLSKVLKLSNSRKAKIKTRFEEIKSLEGFIELFNKVILIPFCCGDNDRNWSADFDWLIENDTNWVKVMEGKYLKCNPIIKPKETASRQW